MSQHVYRIHLTPERIFIHLSHRNDRFNSDSFNEERRRKSGRLHEGVEMFFMRSEKACGRIRFSFDIWGQPTFEIFKDNWMSLEFSTWEGSRRSDWQVVVNLKEYSARLERYNIKKEKWEVKKESSRILCEAKLEGQNLILDVIKL